MSRAAPNRWAVQAGHLLEGVSGDPLLERAGSGSGEERRLGRGSGEERRLGRRSAPQPGQAGLRPTRRVKPQIRQVPMPVRGSYSRMLAHPLVPQ